MLFATLDTRTRVMALDGNRKALLSDTVGFIRNLPHHLVASFHATLEEAIHADLVLHVVDAAHPQARKNLAAANEVLQEIGIAAPVLLVLNKIDAAADNADYHILKRELAECVEVSALTGAGLP
jgi:GTP-binding protein HflX